MAATPITVVKKKPIALKPTTGEGVPPSGPRAPLPGRMSALHVVEPSYTASGVCAILAMVCFMVLLLLQWVEYKDLAEIIPQPVPKTEVVQ